MANTTDLVIALKREMRTRKITYAVLAKELRLSEAAVKRMFALGDMTLSRIDAICGVLKIELSDLFYLHLQTENRIEHLT